MIELVITACLLMGNCKDVTLTYDAREVSLMTCSLFGQTEAAKWQQQHGDWQVRRWRCGFAREDGEQA